MLLNTEGIEYVCGSCGWRSTVYLDEVSMCPGCGKEITTRVTKLNREDIIGDDVLTEFQKKFCLEPYQGYIDNDRFDNIVEAMLEHCRSTLGSKAKEYATKDRLHNFKLAAELQQCDPKRALSGMMAKHVISLFDMCNSVEETFPIELWEEKLGDMINYCLLLRALVEEDILNAAPQSFS